jgi:hypothetical protein
MLINKYQSYLMNVSIDLLTIIGHVCRLWTGGGFGNGPAACAARLVPQDLRFRSMPGASPTVPSRDPSAALNTLDFEHITQLQF